MPPTYGAESDGEVGRSRSFWIYEIYAEFTNITKTFLKIVAQVRVSKRLDVRAAGG